MKAKRQLTTSRKKPPTERIIKDIRALRDSGKSDVQIRALLGLELRTYQRYTKTIYEEDRNVWFTITQEQLGTELLRMSASLEETYNIAKKISENENATVDERLEALQSKDDSRLNIVHLLVEYPTFVKEKQIETKPYEERYEWKDNAEQVLENERE